MKRALIRSPLRVGQLLFHGTQSREDFEELRGPAWLSDHRGAVDFFTTWHGNEGGHERVLTYRLIARPKLYIVHGRAELAWLADRYDSEYDIQELAERVCDDADGWHIPDNYQPGSDTMLCDPSRFLELVSVEHLGRHENPTAPTRFYGRSGAGVLVLAANTGRVLFSQQRRSDLRRQRAQARRAPHEDAYGAHARVGASPAQAPRSDEGAAGLRPRAGPVSGLARRVEG